MNEENHGVILGRRDGDYEASGFTFVSYEVRNPSGDWRKYLPTKEIQYGKEDSMSCVTFSAINCIEAQETFLTGKETNYSDRWIAKRSNTTISGNYLYIVADTIRKQGLVLETDYPTPPNYTFAEFHKDIPEPLLTELKAKGQDWLSKWEVRAEGVSITKDEMLKHIKHAPLQIVRPGHAIMAFLCEEDIVNYFDTYAPHEKKLPYGQLETAYKLLLTPKTMTKKYIIKDGGRLGVLLLEQFSISGAFAKTPEVFENLKSAFEVPENSPTIIVPDSNGPQN